MTFLLRVLAGIALVTSASVVARPLSPVTPQKAPAKKAAAKKAPAKKAPAKKAVAKKAPAEKAPPAAEEGDGTVRSEEAMRVADWVAATGDNNGLPYAIIDKKNATLLFFDTTGEQLEQVPVLIGIAPGDDATPEVGSKSLSELGPAEKTTPAGRFLAKFGIPYKKERILWVDYATSVAMHTIPPDAAKKERRRERMLSATPDDNRVTFGCINVPKAFYAKYLRPQFDKKGGYVYVLPDTKSLEEVFPRLRAHELGTASLR
ncbi:hypothetical protein [Sphingomonas sp. 3-13AW]|jgi:hypothetical protein|uniref:hypothetical protein n=1 Tax=Sphingomonas sp. 3-13AW TaxID=3050450 RepID=UPI003BB4DF35